jgi:hypothetical protein
MSCKKQSQSDEKGDEPQSRVPGLTKKTVVKQAQLEEQEILSKKIFNQVGKL